jgi:hypothetical protein
MLDKIIVLCGIVIFVVTSLWDINFLNYKSPVEYKNIENIYYDDFTGLNSRTSQFSESDKFAYIYTDIKIKKTSIGFRVTSYFHPARSYVYNRNLQYDDLLTHELYHFHITEYVARMIRKEILTKGVSANSKKIYKKYMTTWNELQGQYDKETNHSYILGKQLDWQNKIDSCLIALNEYNETEIKFY